MIRDICNKNVYHGNIHLVEEPFKSRKGTDFGEGFYVTTDRNQGLNFVKLRARQNDVPVGYLNIFQLSTLDGLSVYEFDGANMEWLNCIVGNRSRFKYGYLAQPFSNYEVLIGKVADDNTRGIISTYLSGYYGEIGSYRAMEFAIEQMHSERLRNQICFKSKRSWERLKFLRGEQVWL